MEINICHTHLLSTEIQETIMGCPTAMHLYWDKYATKISSDKRFIYLPL